MDAIFEILDDVMNEIKTGGFKVIKLLPTEENYSYCYSVGIPSNSTHPELSISGIDPDQGHEIINFLAKYLLKNKDVQLNENSILIKGLFTAPLKLIKIPKEISEQKFNISKTVSSIQETEMPNFYQIVYPDENFKFPGDKNCNKEYENIQTEIGLTVTQLSIPVEQTIDLTSW